MSDKERVHEPRPVWLTPTTWVLVLQSLTRLEEIYAPSKHADVLREKVCIRAAIDNIENQLGGKSGSEEELK